MLPAQKRNRRLFTYYRVLLAMYKPYFMKRAKLAIHSETLRDEDQRTDKIALVKSTQSITGYGFLR